jgi:hypothetical protein
VVTGKVTNGKVFNGKVFNGKVFNEPPIPICNYRVTTKKFPFSPGKISFN